MFLRVLRDALFGRARLGRPAAAARRLSALLPEPARAGFATPAPQCAAASGCSSSSATAAGWRVDGEPSTPSSSPPVRSKRRALVAPLAPAWAARAAALRYEPIVTVYLRRRADRAWPAPMVALRSDARRAPAQFAFDLRPLGRRARAVRLRRQRRAAWVERGVPALEAATLAQARAELPGAMAPGANAGRSRSAPPSPARRPALDRRRRSPRACARPATTSTALTPARWRVQCDRDVAAVTSLS